MELHVINTGFFKLDGGAMFGVVPKVLWQKSNPPDEKNMCTWAMRCLLINTGKELILVDNGIGNKQDENFFSHYYLHGNDNLDGSLKKPGISKDDVTDMFLTHLHFDHCGGSIVRDTNGKLLPAFKNARYWSHEKHWEWATHPNPREKASFLKENILPIKESGMLNFATATGNSSSSLHPEIGIQVVNGHTEAMMLPSIPYKGTRIIYCADLFPSSSHIPLPWIMGYDVRPLITMQEKVEILTAAVENNWVLFFEHDPEHECCTLEKTEKGIRVKERFPLSAL